MKYLSVREVAENWEVSEAMIRKYCTQKRIPGARQKGGVWVIPEGVSLHVIICLSTFEGVL